MAQANTKQAIGIVVIILLLLSNVYLLFNKYGVEEKQEELKLELNSVEDAQSDLEEKYDEVYNELEAQKTDNEELNAIIEQQQDELTKRKKQISQLIYSGKKSKTDLNKANDLIKGLATQRDRYLSEIDAKNDKIRTLERENVTRKAANQVLQQEITSERRVTENLTQEKTKLTQEKRVLENKSKDLEEKANYAAVLQVSQLSATPLRMKRGEAKRVRKDKAKNTERVEVCFNVPANPIARTGPQEFYLRLVSPQGTTMAIESMGSGVLVNKATNEQVRYTVSEVINYDNTQQKFCIYWAEDSFSAGQYSAEIYNQGHKVGQTTFKLN